MQLTIEGQGKYEATGPWRWWAIGTLTSILLCLGSVLVAFGLALLGSHWLLALLLFPTVALSKDKPPNAWRRWRTRYAHWISGALAVARLLLAVRTGSTTLVLLAGIVPMVTLAFTLLSATWAKRRIRQGSPHLRPVTPSVVGRAGVSPTPAADIVEDEEETPPASVARLRAPAPPSEDLSGLMHRPRRRE